ncbi:hypothetical protein FQN57_006859 [Myotisia sp. PD_48]|nr:hypothetical protein FQN57_006859 [Myotisia sp. PD_48]
MSSRRFVQTPEQPQAITKRTGTNMSSSSKISNSTSTKSQIPMPSSSIARSRKGSTTSEPEDQTRLRLIRSNSSSRRPSREPSPSIAFSPPSYSLIPSTSRARPPAVNKIPSPAPPSALSLKYQQQVSADGRRRNVLRRKAPSIEQYAERNRARFQVQEGQKTSFEAHRDSPTHTPDQNYLSNPEITPATDDSPHPHHQDTQPPQFSRQPVRTPDQNYTANPDLNPSIENAQIRQQYHQLSSTSRQPAPEAIPATTTSHPRVLKEFAGLSTTINTRNLPPPTPNFTGGSSPSTRYSESPGFWSSRNSTPTSLSSYSPGIVLPTNGSRLKQPSPTISRSQKLQQSLARTYSPDDIKRAPGSTKLPIRAQTEPIPRTLTTGNERPVITRHETAPYTRLEIPDPNYEVDTKITKPNSVATIERVTSRNAESPSLLPSLTTTPTLHPTRPSRRGIEQLRLESSPVIQSNLSLSRLPTHRRRRSSETSYTSRSPAYPTSLVNASTDSLQSKVSSRIPAPSPSPNHFNPPSNSQSRTATPVSTQPIKKKSTLSKGPHVQPKKTEQAPSQPDVKAKRFGIFSKRSKSVPEIQHEGQARRGPAAGTGHEGYGKYSQRGRRPSIGSSAGRTRSTSTNRSGGNSSGTELELDGFLLDRLEPVIISGGGVDGASLSRTQSEQSASSVSLVSFNDYRSQHQARQYGSETGPLLLQGRDLIQSPESLDTSPTRSPFSTQSRTPTVKKRRSFRNSRLFGGQKELNNHLSPVNSVTESRRPSDASANSHFEPHNAVQPKPQKQLKEKKSGKLGRWNFFQRSQQSRDARTSPEKNLRTVPNMPVAIITKLPTPRTVAHYAVLDNEQLDSDSLKEILNRIEESPPTPEDILAATSNKGLGLQRKHGHSILLPSPPIGLADYPLNNRPCPPKVFFNTEASSRPDPAQKPARPSRLTSVGRIPPVVSRATEQPKPSIQSFSRPFSMGEGPSLTVTAHGTSGTVDSQQYANNYDIGAKRNQSGSSPLAQKEFMSFSPRRGSEVSPSESSDGCGGNLAAVTALPPVPGSQLTGDEVWHEYDEFLDKVVSPPLDQDHEIGSPGSYFNLVKKASRTLQEGLGAGNDSSTYLGSLGNSELKVPVSPLNSNVDSVHLSHSMILSALHISLTPSSPVSLGDLISAYAGSKRGSPYLDGATMPNTPNVTHALRTLEGKFDDHRENHPPKQEASETTSIADDEEAEKREEGPERFDPMAHANIRSGSLMTSRWLSFGRVLFSPASNHVKSEDQARILVIDGLGNDDWSFYCALTYPAATVYNLTSVIQADSTSNNPEAWDPPPNHRTIHHSHAENPFPFPKGFFTVVTIRFPSMCSEGGVDTMIAESKRVLRTGGYLELAILDLDMVNMGNRTRKAMRMLKERMYNTDPNICLKPASDNIQKLLGKRGFDNLNRCVVVVPAAGTIVQSSDTSSSAPSIAMLQKGRDQHNRPPSDDVEVSLGDLLSDPAPSASNDESITKMVAKVARWWHTQCYEMAVFPSMSPKDSIWADKRLLRECQRRGTGFRLLIAYVQKSSEVTRRTASV